MTWLNYTLGPWLIDCRITIQQDKCMRKSSYSWAISSYSWGISSYGGAITSYCGAITSYSWAISMQLQLGYNHLYSGAITSYGGAITGYGTTLYLGYN